MFNGIPISEYRLLAHSVIFTILLLGLAVAFGFWLYVSLTMKNRKKGNTYENSKKKQKATILLKSNLKGSNVRTSADVSARKKTSLPIF